jgi:phosphate transport system permease protein
VSSPADVGIPSQAGQDGRDRLGPTRRRPTEILFHGVLLASLVIGVVFLATLLIYVLVRGWPRLDPRLWENFNSIRRPERAGAQAAIFGTIWVMVLTALICLPVGILAAIHMEEYADKTKWWNRAIELNLQNLAAVPSIVYGILGLGIIARQFALGTSIITAAITLSLLVLPVVVVASREAIRAVPSTIRDGSLALGATRWQTIRKQILPAAIPGIATGSILALSRAIGEAAPLLLLGAVTFVAFNPDSLTSAYTVLPIQIYDWIRQSREEFQVLAAAAIAVLLAILLLMNSVAIYIRNRYQKRW